MAVGTTNVDVVLVIDTSGSMSPCLDQLRQHLGALLQPLQGFSYRVRFGLVGLSHGHLYLLPPSVSLASLYDKGSQEVFFTEDTSQIVQRLGQLETGGDEDNLLALDVALDHPFGPLSTTKRVIALFSDEPLEGGMRRKVDLLEGIPRIVEKLHARRVKLFCAMPYSDAAQALSEANGSEIEDVADDAGLASVDFKTLLEQMGKSISVSSVQSGAEEHYQRALFGQDK